jgi:hypothetical protein
MRNNETRMGVKSPPTGQAQPGFSGDSLYELPTEFVALPSKGMFYPPGHPLCNQEVVEIKYMTAKQEDILTSAALIKQGVVIDRFIDSIVVDKNIKAIDLLIGDRNALVVAARKTGYGAYYLSQVICPKCDTAHEIPYNLDQIEYKSKCFDEEYLVSESIEYDSEQHTFNYKLPVSKVEITFAFMTGHHEKTTPSQNPEENTITGLLSSMIQAVNGNSDTAAIKAFVDNMPAMDSKKLRNIYQELTPKVDMSRRLVCDNCLAITNVEVPFSTEFFWPK